MKKGEREKETLSILQIQRTVDLATAYLLFINQITISSTVISSGGFRVTVGGPITGTGRLVSKSGSAVENLVIRGISVTIGLLLLVNQINVQGAFIGPGRFTINITGPIFGIPRNEPNLNVVKRFKALRAILKKQFKHHPRVWERIERGVQNGFQ
ncbi:hypothetical protein [Ammoniphilus sp. YIM 78166]|uniref:hypothetical protein n=1 Tax=Ammoniphilus sp. YIM 78166 TaxID=1644106 RepID=UPI00106F605B|nr:hypothetical protein [Ammoniphilus sp. YIM 78166]